MDEYNEFSKETFQRKNFPGKVPKIKNNAKITENGTNNTADNFSKTLKVKILSKISKLLRNEFSPEIKGLLLHRRRFVDISNISIFIKVFKKMLHPHHI